MAIGEFGGAPAASAASGPMYAAPAYWLYEMSQAALNPSRAFADAARLFYRNPANPLSYTSFGKSMAAGLELFERSTRRYGKPEWNINSTVVGGEHVPVHIASVWERPFCRLLHFERAFEHAPRRPQPRLLIVAPMSGHYRDACCAARSKAFCPTTTSTSPNGSMRAWCRCPRAASISTITSTT